MKAQLRRVLTSSSVYLIFCSCGQGRRSRGECSPSRLSYQSPTLPAAVPSPPHFFSSLPISPLSAVIGFLRSSSSLGSAVRAETSNAKLVRTRTPSSRTISVPHRSFVGQLGDCQAAG